MHKQFFKWEKCLFDGKVKKSPISFEGASDILFITSEKENGEANLLFVLTQPWLK